MKKRINSNKSDNAFDVYAETKKMLDAFETKYGELRKRKIDLFLTILGILISFFGIALPVVFFFLTWNIYDNFNKSHDQIIKMQEKVAEEWELLNQKKAEIDKQYREILSELNNAKTQEKALNNLVKEAKKAKDDLANQSESARKYIAEQKIQIEQLSQAFGQITQDYLILQLANQAENELTSKLYGNAIIEYENLFKLFPNKKKDRIFCANLGFAYFKCSNYEKSIKYYTDALESSPDSAVIYLSKAGAEFEFCQYENALQSASKALEILEKNIASQATQSIKNISASSTGSKDTSASSIISNRVGRIHLLIEATKSNCYLITAAAFEKKGNNELAQENYMAAIEHQATNYQALYLYGCFLFNQKLYSKAEKYLRQAVALELNPDTLLGLAEVEVAQCKYAEALLTLDKIIVISQVPRAYELRAFVKSKLQDFPGAYEDIVTFSALRNSVDAFRTKARIEVGLKKYSEALMSIDRAIKLDNQSSELQIYKIALLLLNEKYDYELIESNIMKINKMKKSPTVEHYLKIFSEINNQLKQKNAIDWECIFDMNDATREVKNNIDISTCLIQILRKYPIDSFFPALTKWWYNTLYIQEKNDSEN